MRRIIYSTLQRMIGLTLIIAMLGSCYTILGAGYITDESALDNENVPKAGENFHTPPSHPAEETPEEPEGLEETQPLGGPEVPEKTKPLEEPEEPQESEVPEPTEEPDNEEDASNDGSSGDDRFLEDEETPPLEEDIDENDEEDEQLPDDLVIEGSAAYVSDTSALAMALKIASVDTIYLTNDLTITSHDMPINTERESLTISGSPPGTDARYKLTEYNSAAQLHALYIVNGGNLKSVTLRDMIIEGKNYYGTVTVSDSRSGLHISYINISYIGPQMIYNTYGTAWIEDCDIDINPNGGPSDPGEVGELSGVTLAGTVNITQSKLKTEINSNEIFFMKGSGGEIRVKSGAVVNVTSIGPSGFIYNQYDNITMTVEENAWFSFTGPYQFSEYHPLRALTVEDGGKMIVDITDVSYNHILRVDGTVNVGKGSWLQVYRRGGTANHTTLGAYDMYFDDPESVVLYNVSFKPLWAILQPRTVDILAQQINYWKTAGDGGFEHYPVNHWLEPDENGLHFTGTLANGEVGDWTSVTTNWAPGGSTEDIGPDKDNFSTRNARIISFGRLPLDAEFVPSSSVDGATASNAKVRVDYTDTEEAARSAHTIADSSGDFTVTLPNLAQQGQVLSVWSNWHYLFSEVFVESAAGLLALVDVPPVLAFQTTSISGNSQIVDRWDEDWGFIVYDSRGMDSSWRLYACQAAQLVSASGHKLESALIFADGETLPQPLGNENNPTLIYSSSQNTQHMQKTVVSWTEDRGILLWVQAGQGLINTVYQAKVEWILIDAP